MGFQYLLSYTPPTLNLSSLPPFLYLSFFSVCLPLFLFHSLFLSFPLFLYHSLVSDSSRRHCFGLHVHAGYKLFCLEVKPKLFSDQICFVTFGRTISYITKELFLFKEKIFFHYFTSFFPNTYRTS